MTLSRRSLLTGLLSSAAVIAAGPAAKVISGPVGLGSNVLEGGGALGEHPTIWRVAWDKETIFRMFPQPVHCAPRIADIVYPTGAPSDFFQMLARDVKTFVHGSADWATLPERYQLAGLRSLESGA